MSSGAMIRSRPPGVSLARCLRVRACMRDDIERERVVGDLGHVDGIHTLRDGGAFLRNVARSNISVGSGAGGQHRSIGSGCVECSTPFQRLGLPGSQTRPNDVRGCQGNLVEHRHVLLAALRRFQDVTLISSATRGDGEATAGDLAAEPA